jgi:hypothetical protein
LQQQQQHNQYLLIRRTKEETKIVKMVTQLPLRQANNTGYKVDLITHSIKNFKTCYVHTQVRPVQLKAVKGPLSLHLVVALAAIAAPALAAIAAPALAAIAAPALALAAALNKDYKDLNRIQAPLDRQAAHVQ